MYSVVEPSHREWGSLPVLQVVGRHLSPCSLRAARLACRHWRTNLGYGLQHCTFELSRYKHGGELWQQKVQRLCKVCPCVAACELVVWNASDRLHERLPQLMQAFRHLHQLSLSFRQGLAPGDLEAMAQLPLLRQLRVRSERCASASFLPGLAALTGLTQLELSLWCSERDSVEVSLCCLAPLRQLRHFSITKRHDYNSCYVSLPWSKDEATALAQAWPHLESLQLHLSVLDLFHSGLNSLHLLTNLKHLSIAALESFSPVLEWVWVDAGWLPPSLQSLSLDGVVVDVSAELREAAGMPAHTCTGHGCSARLCGAQRSNSTSNEGGIRSSSAVPEAPLATTRLHRSGGTSINQSHTLAGSSSGSSSCDNADGLAQHAGLTAATSASATHAAKLGGQRPMLVPSANGALFYMPVEYMPHHSCTQQQQQRPLLLQAQMQVEQGQQQHQLQGAAACGIMQPIDGSTSGTAATSGATSNRSDNANQCTNRTSTSGSSSSSSDGGGTSSGSGDSSTGTNNVSNKPLLPALCSLGLDSCRLGDSQLQHLASAVAPSLQHLELAYCRGISDRGLLALPLLRRLARLHITSVDNASITAGGVCSALEPLQHQLTSLRWTSDGVTFEGQGVQELLACVATFQELDEQQAAAV